MLLGVTEAARSKPAAIAWEGDSREVLGHFPDDIRWSFGYSLRAMQNGRRPRCDCRPMASVGKGVWELKEGDERSWYRLMYLTEIEGVIHVLHCFEKDSRKTGRRDLEIARQRLKAVLHRMRGEE